MGLPLAAVGLIAGIAAMQWGAQAVCGMLDFLRRRHGLSQVGGGALIGLATATPELSINIVAVGFGWPGIGLGTALGSNLPTLPLIFLIAHLTLRRQRRRLPDQPTAVPVGDHTHPVQTLPYLGIVILLAALTLPPPWAGLQPLDGVILLAAYLAFLTQALLRRRRPATPLPFGWGRLLRLVWAFAAIAAGAVVAVIATNSINRMFGIPELVGGLFLTGLLCAVPETASAAHLIKDDKATAAVSAAVADGTASISLAFLPLALVHAPVGDTALYAVSLAYLALVLVLYLLLSRRSERGADLSARKAGWIGGCYCLYLLTVSALQLAAA